MTIRGGHGDDDLTGGTGDDIFNLTLGGNDTANGGGGNDIFWVGATLTADDHIDGGDGADKVTLDGDYSAELVFGAATMVNVETLALQAGHDYSLTTDDNTVAAGGRLTIKAGGLSGLDRLAFDGSAELDGHFDVFAGSGDDSIAGGAKGDRIHLEKGGADTINAGGGGDVIYVGGALTNSDSIDGGAGSDVLVMDGDYWHVHSRELAFMTNTLLNVEEITFVAGHSYTLLLNHTSVPVGATLTINGSSLAATDQLDVVGTDIGNGSLHIIGGVGDDGLFGGLIGGGKADIFDFSLGGSDHAFGNPGDDVFIFGATFDHTDSVDGEGDNDTLSLEGNYGTVGGGAFHIDGDMMYRIDALDLLGAHDYVLATSDNIMEAGGTLTVNGTALGSSNILKFDGSAIDLGSLIFDAGAETDTLIGGTGADIFNMGVNLTDADSINGGDGVDTLNLDGDYTGANALTLGSGPGVIASIEFLDLAGGHSYRINIDPDFLTSGATCTIDASALGAGDVLGFDGSGNSTVHFTIIGGAGNDTIYGGMLPSTIYGGAGDDTIVGSLIANTIDGGSGNDTIRGSINNDTITGGAGADHFIYGSAGESSGDLFDTIADFEASADKFGLGNMATTVTGIYAASGSADTFDIDDDLAALNAMHAGGATIVTVTGGNLNGHTLLMIDADDNARYSGSDYVFDITNYTGTITTANFI
ncbi:MAG TPA: calcium-binding protein [Rhizomicrobium sp.]|nr:calcium-binding protein [Rhizomicrobium sp.]